MQKGISFTMGMIVSALVIIATAVLVLGIVQPYLSETGERAGDTTEQRYDDLTLQQRRGDCQLQKENFCTGAIPADVQCPSSLAQDQQWACKTQVGGEWCYVYWQGAYSTIPSCTTGN